MFFSIRPTFSLEILWCYHQSVFQVRRLNRWLLGNLWWNWHYLLLRHLHWRQTLCNPLVRYFLNLFDMTFLSDDILFELLFKVKYLLVFIDKLWYFVHLRCFISLHAIFVFMGLSPVVLIIRLSILLALEFACTNKSSVSRRFADCFHLFYDCKCSWILFNRFEAIVKDALISRILFELSDFHRLFFIVRGFFHDCIHK
jgi:hypothetical protein